MSNEIFFDGKQYISANDASALSGLTRDYVARLCREGKMSGKRIGKNWYVENASLRSFLVGQEYNKSLRRESLARERTQEYRAADAPSSPGAAQRSAAENTASASHAVQQPEEYSARTLSRPLAVSPMYGKLATAVAQAGTRVTDNAANIAASPSGVADAAIRMAAQGAAHVPAYTITPLAEFFHKLTALTLAFMLTFGTYALVDPRAAHFAGESAKDTARSLRTTYDSLTGGGVQNLVANVHSQVALAAENPSATFAAASAALTTSIPNAAASFARTVNSRINSLVYAIAFPQSLALFSGGTTGGSVAVNIAPYARPVRSIASNGASPAATGPTTVINNPIVQRTVEVQRIVAESGGITEEELNTRLNQLDNKLTSQIYSITAVGGSTPVASGGIVNMIAATNRIDQLSGAAITGGTITGTAISGGSISGTSVSATTLSASGDTSLSDTTVNGDLTVTGAVNFTGTPLTATDATFTSATTTNLFATSTTLVNATSTNFFATNASTTNSTSTSLYSSSLVAGNATSTNLFASLARFTSAIVDALTSYGEIAAPFFSATSTTATSTFSGGLLATRAPTRAHTFSPWTIGAANSNLFDASLVVNPASAVGDSNLIAAAVNGSVKFLVDAEGDVYVNNLTSVGSVTLSTTTASTFTVEGNATFGDSITVIVTVNGSLIVTGTTTTSTIQGNFGICTTTPWARLSLAGSAGGTVPLFTISSSTAGFATSTALLIDANGKVGIGTTSPSAAFAVSSPIYIGGTGENATSTFDGNVHVYGLLKVGTSSSYISDSDISTIGNLTVTGATNLTGLLSLTNASTSQFSVFQKAYFGATATSTFDSAGNLSVAGTLGVTGNTTLANATSTNLFSTTASSTNLYSTNANLGIVTLGNATTTSLFSSTASSTNLFSQTAALGTLSAGTLALSSALPVSSDGTGAVATVATSTLAVGTGLTNSGTLGYQIGGTNSSISFAAIAANSLWANQTGVSAVPTAISTSSLFTWTGTGDVVRGTSPTLVTPALGTPSALVGTNITGTGASFTAGAATVLATARNINGVSFNGSADITITAASSTLLGDSNTFSGNNTLSGLSSFARASTTLFSSYGPAYFGSTATSSFATNGALTLVNALTYGGVTLSNAVTGTGNMVLSASPTFTGTIAAAALNTSGVITSTATGANTLPYASSTALTVSGHCVTADTRLRRRRKAKKGEEDEADE